MSSKPDAPSANRSELLNDVIARYTDDCDAGHTPNEQEILDRHPELQSELREFFDNRKQLISLLGEPDHPPKLGDDYDILELVDDGGQGTVYMAHQRSLNKIVAIKVPRRSSLQSDPEAIRKEARRAARLRHPNTAVVDHGG